MIQESVTLTRDIGGRQAANFVYAVSQYPCNLWITKEGKRVNGKSILGLLSAKLMKDDAVIISFDTDNCDIVNRIIGEINNK